MANISATRYVHAMLDKGQSFEEYALSCAWAFGALIMMRDDAMDAPIPDEFKPSDYHREAMDNARKSLAGLYAMSADEITAYGQKQKSERLASLAESKRERDAEIQKCNAMLAEVQAWAPPTPDHECLKKFMIDQIQTSTRGVSDYYAREIAAIEAMPVEEVHAAAIRTDTRSIKYHAEEYEAEVARAAERTEWVKALRESLQPALEAK